MTTIQDLIDGTESLDADVGSDHVFGSTEVGQDSDTIREVDSGGLRKIPKQSSTDWSGGKSFGNRDELYAQLELLGEIAEELSNIRFDNKEQVKAVMKVVTVLKTKANEIHKGLQ